MFHFNMCTSGALVNWCISVYLLLLLSLLLLLLYDAVLLNVECDSNEWRGCSSSSHSSSSSVDISTDWLTDWMIVNFRKNQREQEIERREYKWVLQPMKIALKWENENMYYYLAFGRFFFSFAPIFRFSSCCQLCAYSVWAQHVGMIFCRNGKTAHDVISWHHSCPHTHTRPQRNGCILDSLVNTKYGKW